MGEPLPVYVLNGIITNIKLTIRNKVNFLDIIKSKAKLLKASHIDNITFFDTNYKFYLLKNKFDYILAVKVTANNSIEKIRYSTNGAIIKHVTDNLIND